MTSRPRVVLATQNEHKLREISEILSGAPFTLVGLGDYPSIILPPETGVTFEANAIPKADTVASSAGLVAIGDDSGLEVDALDGAPGVYSARYAGPGATDTQNLQKLLDALKNVPDGERSARYVCALAVAAPGHKTAVVFGTCEGVIIRTPRGSNGFGYDPVFLIPEDGRTLAEYSPQEKNAISHRYRAVAAALPLILNRLEL